MCAVGIVRECSHIFFFCGRDPFTEVENAHEVLTGLVEWPAGLSHRLRDQRTSPPRLCDHLISPSSPKLQTLYSRSRPKQEFENPLCLMYFLFMAGYRNSHTSFSSGNFLILSLNGNICLSIQGNKLYFRHPPFLGPTLLMLSCNPFDPAKFIHGTLSLAKLV